MLQKSSLFRVFLTLFVLLAFFPAAPAQATAPFDVNSTTDLGDSNLGDCVCRNTNNTCSLRAAVQEANACAGDNDIVLNNGTTYTIGSSLPVNPASGLKTEKIFVYTDDNEASKAIIKGSGAEDYPIFSIWSTLDLTNVTIRDSEGIDVGSDATLNLNKVLLTANYLDESDPTDMRSGGGAIQNNYGNVSIYNSQFTNNISTGCGGAINNHGHLSIDLSQFSGNQAAHGGAICHVGWQHPTTNVVFGMGVARSEINSNTAAGNGGGVFITGPNTLNTSIVINISTISANDANWGGGIYIGPSQSEMFGGGLTLLSSTVSGNTAGNGAGIMITNTGNYAGRYETYLENSTISSNQALMHGGGIYMTATGTLAISNSTITANIADSDGNDNGDGGGIRSTSSMNELRLENTILAGNLDASSGEQVTIVHDCRGNLDLFGYNLIGKLDTTKCVVNTDATTLRGSNSSPLNPLLGPLDDYGYSAFTHELIPGSPAINGGDPAGCKNPNDSAIGSDQRGESRPYGSRCDIGAVEAQFSVKKVFLPTVLR